MAGGGRFGREQRGRGGERRGSGLVGWVGAVRKPNNCCFSRRGLAKARYHSLVEARAALERSARQRGVVLEVYACEVQPDTWHLRKVRS